MDNPQLTPQLTPQQILGARARAPEFLRDLMEHVAEVLKEGGMPPDQAVAYGFYAALRLRPRWAKQLVYFGEGLRIDQMARDAQIWREFNGRNVDELAAKYRLSRVWVYRIIEAMRAEETAARQPELPLESQP